MFLLLRKGSGLLCLRGAENRLMAFNPSASHAVHHSSVSIKENGCGPALEAWEPINPTDSPEAVWLPLISLALIAGMLSRAFPEVLSPRNPVSVFQLSGQYNYKPS